jgi:hypothetical protein
MTLPRILAAILLLTANLALLAADTIVLSLILP